LQSKKKNCELKKALHFFFSSWNILPYAQNPIEEHEQRGQILAGRCSKKKKRRGDNLS